MKRINKTCSEIRLEHHVARVHMFETHAGSIEANPFRHKLGCELTICDRQVMELTP